MSYVAQLRCLRCGATYAPDAIEYVCSCRPNIGSDVGTLDVVYDYAAIASVTSPLAIATDPDRSIARFAPLLPIRSRDSLPPLAVGNTPLLHAKRLGQSLGLSHLFVKDDGRNPSASFKDRASAIAVARAQEEQRPIVATASTGNAAAALGALAAAAGQATVIFVPKTAPPAKIAQLLVYGCTVLAVDGTYDDAFDLCMEACREFGWYNRSTGYNPYMTEGKKTVSYEIALPAWRRVDRQRGPARRTRCRLCLGWRWLHYRRRAQRLQGSARLGLDRQDAPPLRRAVDAQPGPAQRLAGRRRSSCAGTRHDTRRQHQRRCPARSDQGPGRRAHDRRRLHTCRG